MVAVFLNQCIIFPCDLSNILTFSYLVSKLKFSSAGKGVNARDLAGAALLCFSFTPKDVNTQRTSKVNNCD